MALCEGGLGPAEVCGSRVATMGQGEQPLEVAQAREVWLAVVGGRWVGRGGHVGENDICCEQVKAVRAQRSA